MELQSTRGTISVPASLQKFYEDTHVPGAVRSGSTVWVTGQTGLLADDSVPSSPIEQIRQAFVLVGECLQVAGAKWSEVVQVTTYTVGLRQHGETMIEVAGEFLLPPFPAWTAVGVSELWEEGTMFELSCVAVLPDATVQG